MTFHELYDEKIHSQKSLRMNALEFFDTHGVSMETAPCLSVKQPWAAAIVSGWKRFENRTWSTAFRGWCLIHAGKSRARIPKEKHWHGKNWFHLPQLSWRNASEVLTFGAIVGAAFVVDCRAYTPQASDAVGNDPHFEGPFCFALQDPVHFSDPIVATGQLGFFRLDLLDKLRANRRDKV